MLADGRTVRYGVSGSFSAGDVTATFTPGSWKVKPFAGGSSTPSTGTTTQVTLGTVTAGAVPSFAVEGESLDVVFPAPVGDTISAASLSGAGQVTLGGAVLTPVYVDVIFPVATGFVLDPTTLLTGGVGQVTLGGSGLGTVSIASSAVPQVLADGVTVRYAVTANGQFSATGGAVTATFTRGSWKVEPAGGGTSTIDPGAGTTQSTLGTVTAGTLPAFAVGGVAIDTSVTPQLVQQGGTIVRYALTGIGTGAGTVSPTFSAGAVTASFVPGTWSYVPATQTLTAPFVDTGTQTIDVTFPVRPGYVLDPTSLHVGGVGQVTLGGTGLGGVAIQTSATPQVLANGVTVRYHITGSFAVAGGTVTVTFTPGSWSVAPADGSAAPTVDAFATASPVALGTVAASPTTIDVTFPVQPGSVLDPASLHDGGTGQLTLGGAGLGTVQTDTSATPQVLADGVTVRYQITGRFAVAGGAVTATFVPGTWSVKPAAGGSSTTETAATSAPVTVETVTPAALPSFLGEVETIDVPFPVPAGGQISAPTGPTLLTLGGAGLGSVALDPSYTPQVQAGGTTVRLEVSGHLASSGAVTATFVPGSWAITGAPDFAVSKDLGDASALPHQGYLDVAFTPTASPDASHPSSITGIADNAVSIAGMTVSAQPLKLANGVYRYLVTGTYSTGTVTVSFAAAVTDSNTFTNAASTESFTVLGPTAALAGPMPNSGVGSDALDLEGYLDVAFTAPAGKTIDPATVTDTADAEFTLSGSGTAGWSIDATKAPILVSTSGSTDVFRYWTSGTYTSGTVSITFIQGSYGFTDGTTSTFTGPGRAGRTSRSTASRRRTSTTSTSC